jgi:hypothetical protein
MNAAPDLLNLKALIGVLGMLNKNPLGLRLVEKPLSNGIRQTGSQRDRAPVALRHAVGSMKRGGNAVAPSIDSRAPVESDALARAIAEIEIASAALRQSDPTLKPWQPNAEAQGSQRHLPVWILISAVWAAALLSLSVAISGIVYLAG